MNTQIKLWLDFLSMSLSLFSFDNRISVFHYKHSPCENCAGDILFELSPNFQLYLSLILKKYLLLSSYRGEDGELDFVFDTKEVRETQDLKNGLWIVKVTETKKMSPREKLEFVYFELAAAVDYLREYFDPDVAPWDVPDAVLDPIPDFTN